MKAPVSRRRGRRPVLQPITMDLLGIGRDGNLYLWSAAQQVQPLDRFPMGKGGRIASGHYVLERNGKAVTAHVGNAARVGELTVQYMCKGGSTMMLPCRMVEPMLLGRVVPDPKEEAQIRDMLRRLTSDAVARQTSPHRRRGAG